MKQRREKEKLKICHNKQLEQFDKDLKKVSFPKELKNFTNKKSIPSYLYFTTWKNRRRLVAA